LQIDWAMCVRLMLVALLGAGCAASPAESLDGSALGQGDDDATREPDARTAPPEVDDDDGDGDDDGPGIAVRDGAAAPEPNGAQDGSADAGSSRDAASSGDGARPSEVETPRDAATDVPDAQRTAPDASAQRDAAALADAAAREAGAPPATQDGGGVVRDGGFFVPEGGMSNAPQRCDRSSQCESLCLFVGVFPCCREDHVCGCTWAPGAYCL
jgi:hypothetical protein